MLAVRRRTRTAPTVAIRLRRSPVSASEYAPIGVTTDRPDMSILSRLPGSKTAVAPAQPAGPCSHTQLVPRWANAADMGKGNKTSEYVCAPCSAHFTPEQGRKLRGF